MKTITTAYVLKLLVASSGPVPLPWAETLPTTAEAIADSANDSPLFAGDDGPAKTASYLVGVSAFESLHNPQAKGDCRKDGLAIDCRKPGAVPHSFCLGQINDTNFATLHVTSEELIGDVRVCVRAMSVMLRQSIRICSTAFPSDPELGLGWYTAGGPRCLANDKSRHRVRKARWLFAHVASE